MIPAKLKERDEVRVIAPSWSLSLLSKETIDLATKRLEGLGLKVSFGKHVAEKDDFVSSPIELRVADLHEAFADKKVKAILTVIGGFNCNQMLKYVDFNLLKENPKVFCGFSDITALQNAFHAKTSLVTYSGPHYSNFGMKKGLDYTIDYFKKCLFESKEFEVKASREWSDDEWFKNQENRVFHKNEGHFIINEGKAEGTIIGGNLCTLNLLYGTEFMPSLKNSILFLEDDEESRAHHFDRNLQSLIHQPEFEKVKGMVIGRFQKASGISNQTLEKIIKTKKELEGIPVIAGLDFGHTTPSITFPVGGKASIKGIGKETEIKITEH
ncbi:MAG: S66 peptidase family protein [archaeon]